MRSLYFVSTFNTLKKPITDPLISTESRNRFARALVLVECRRKPASSMIFISKRPPVAKSEKKSTCSSLSSRFDLTLRQSSYSWRTLRCLFGLEWQSKHCQPKKNDGKILRGREKAAATAAAVATTTATTTTTTCCAALLAHTETSFPLLSKSV